MSEYNTPDACARLIGDRWAPEGLLTKRIREQPFAVVLFDEIEKAHRSVLNLLLQLFDEGRLTDAAGNTAHFNHTVVIMTSNLGTKPTMPIGFGDSTDRILGDIERAVRDFFPPELFNRIDKVVPFEPLTTPVAEQIATKELALLLARRGLTERNIFVYANEAVKERIVREAFDPRYGARTVKAYLEHTVASVLTEEITRGVKASMTVMHLYESDGTLRLHVEPLVEAAPHEVPFVLEPLLKKSVGQLPPHFDTAISTLASALENQPPASGEHSYFRDELQNRVHALHQWRDEQLGGVDPELIEAFEYSHEEVTLRAGDSFVSRRMRRFDRKEMAPAAEKAGKEAWLDKIAETTFLARNLRRVDDPEEHDIWLKLLRVGHQSESDQGKGLLEWLASVYLSHSDLFDSATANFADGSVRDIDSLDELQDLLQRRPRQLLLRLSGLFARGLFAGEEGCHIWRSFTSEPEIVRVCALAPGSGQTGRDVIERHEAAVVEFAKALEHGDEPLPTNPNRLLPTVRALTFRRPLRPGEIFPVEVEDFRSAFADTLQVRTVERALSMLWLLGISSTDLGDAS